MKNFPPLLNFVATLPCKTNTSVNVRVKLWRFCVEKHQTSFLQICGLQTVQISIQLITRSVMSCSVVYSVYQRKIHTINELKQRLIEVWCGLEQSTVNMAIDQWRKRLN